MASNVTRDHHRWTRDIKSPQDTTIDVEGDLIVDVSGGQFTIQDNTGGDPDLAILCTSDSSSGGNISLTARRNSTDAGQDSDILGKIDFNGRNDAPENINYARIQCTISDATDGTEAGRLLFNVLAKEALDFNIPIQGISIIGSNTTNGEVNVGIANGAASLTTIAGDLDIDGAKITSAGALEIDPGGQLSVTGHDMSIDTSQSIYLDGGGDTYIREHSSNLVRYVVGGTAMMVMTEAGIEGDTVNFGTSGVGFNQFTAVFDATDTYVRFNIAGNKGHLTMTANVTDVHLHFPNVSCNCQLIVLQDGTGGWDVANWKTFDQAAGNESTVIWSGGSAPGLTETADKLDILSFYWDNTNHKAYGVASTNF